MAGITSSNNLNPERSSLSSIYAVGSNYDVGFAVGARFSSEITEFYTKATSMRDTLLPFYETPNGRLIYDEYLNITKEYYPQYVQEMQGIADGSGRPFHEVFLLHIEPEITTILRKKEETKSQTGSCTTTMLNYVDANGKQQTILAHNEDASPGMRKCLTYVVHARIIARDNTSMQPCEEWTAFCYPGHLGGNCFSVNSSGLAITTNRLSPVNIQRSKIPYYIAVRALLTAKSIDDAVSMIAKTRDNMATGMRYDRIPGVNECDEPSSDHRKTRVEELPVPSNLNDMLSIIGDTKDEQFPIYRSGKAPDYLFTSATGVFDLVESTLSIYLDNPSGSTQGPVMIMPISNGQR